MTNDHDDPPHLSHLRALREQDPEFFAQQIAAERQAFNDHMLARERLRGGLDLVEDLLALDMGPNLRRVLGRTAAAYDQLLASRNGMIRRSAERLQLAEDQP